MLWDHFDGFINVLMSFPRSALRPFRRWDCTLNNKLIDWWHVLFERRSLSIGVPELQAAENRLLRKRRLPASISQHAARRQRGQSSAGACWPHCKSDTLVWTWSQIKKTEGGRVTLFFGFFIRFQVWLVRDVIFPNIWSTWKHNIISYSFPTLLSLNSTQLNTQLCYSWLSAYAISVCLQVVDFKPLKVDYAMNDLAIKALMADGCSTLLKALWVHHIKQGYKQQNWPIIYIWQWITALDFLWVFSKE